MRWLDKIRLRLRSLGRRREAEEQLAAELEFHLEQQAAELRAAGMEPEAARRAALRAFGGTTQIAEECRDRRRVGWLEDLGRDAAYALRGLRRSPGFAAVAIATLALAIGANTAVFSLLDAVLLRSLPVAHPERLMALAWSAKAWPRLDASAGYSDCPAALSGTEAAPGSCTFSAPFYRALRGSGLFAGVFAAGGLEPMRVRSGARTADASARFVSGDYFTTLGLAPALGRLFGTSDDRPGAPPVAVLGYGYWRDRFGGERNVVGRTLEIHGVPVVVAGVAPADFPGTSPGEREDLWMPLAAKGRVAPGYFTASAAPDVWWLMILARLAPGERRASAQAKAQLFFQRATLAGPQPVWKASAAPRLKLAPAGRGLAAVRDQYAQTVRLLFLAVAVILLIALANIAGLLLARGAARRREMAVRGALGAGRGRLARQMLAESLLLAVLGGAAGMLLAFWGARALGAFITENSWGGLIRLGFTPDGRVLGFVLGVVILGGLAFGLLPALGAAGPRLAPALKMGLADAGERPGRRTFSAGHVLVAAQVALAVLLLAGAGLLARTLINLERVDTGFATGHLLSFGLNVKAPQYGPLVARLRAVPGVRAVSYNNMTLLGGGVMTESFYPPGASQAREMEAMDVGPDFFATVGLPIIGGRALVAADFRVPKGGMQPVVINRAFARAFFGRADPLGAGFRGEGKVRFVVVGVVADSKYDSLQAADAPMAFLPMADFGGDILVRTAGDPRAAIPAVRAAVAAVDPDLAIDGMRTETQVIAASLYEQRLLGTLAAMFAALGLALAAIGLYGLLAYEVTRRTREIGIRVALGARPKDVMRQVAWRGLALALTGVAAGIGGGLAATRVVASLLYGVKTSDPLTYAAVAVALIAIALAAALAPARRAARVDPMVALRWE